MIRVMSITDVCDSGREHGREPEGLPAEHAVVVGQRRAPIWQRAPRYFRDCSEPPPRCALKVLLLCCALQFAGCAREQQPSPEIVAEVSTLQQQTLAPSSSPQGPVTISTHPMSVRAEWQIRNSSTAEEYFDWVKQRLGNDYRVISQTDSMLTMGRTTNGDSYTLELHTADSGSTIAVRYLAMAD